MGHKAPDTTEREHLRIWVLTLAGQRVQMLLTPSLSSCQTTLTVMALGHLKVKLKAQAQGEG